VPRTAENALRAAEAAVPLIVIVDPSSGVPVFRQVMDQVRFQIASGVLEPGDELPPTRSLSAELGVNPMTISKAYNLLEREGALERRPGRPLAVRAIADEQMNKSKIAQLRESLAEPARIVRQLGIDRDEAVAVFRDLVRRDPEVKDAGEES
jgi:GntR family transcriptional regulator